MPAKLNTKALLPLPPVKVWFGTLATIVLLVAGPGPCAAGGPTGELAAGGATISTPPLWSSDTVQVDVDRFPTSLKVSVLPSEESATVSVVVFDARS